MRVNVVTGGIIQTEQAHLHYGDDEGIAAVARTIPMQRMGQPSDIADACLFLMERSSGGGDARLHGKASIGVGGHLNPVDRGEDPLMGGLQREWSEELIAEFEPDFRLVGFLNDDTNPVGAVHLGVVFTVEADGHAVAVREHEKLTGRFATPDEILAVWERLETWSQLTFAALNREAATAVSRL